MCSLIHCAATQNFPAHSQSLTLVDTINVDIKLAKEHMLDIINVDIPSPPLSINIPMENHFAKIDPTPLNDMFEIDIPMNNKDAASSMPPAEPPGCNVAIGKCSDMAQDQDQLPHQHKMLNKFTWQYYIEKLRQRLALGALYFIQPAQH